MPMAIAIIFIPLGDTCVAGLFRVCAVASQNVLEA
jgi:hypothetical protein